MKYDVKVTGIGDLVNELITEGMLIIFNENVPEDLAELSVTHTISELKSDVSVGDMLNIGKYNYEIVAVGSTANKTLKELGHCTFKFIDCDTPELPGIMNVKGEKPIVKIGDKITIA